MEYYSFINTTKCVLDFFGCLLTWSAHTKLTGNDGAQVGHVHTCCLSALSLPSIHIHLLSGLKHRLFSVLNFILLEQGPYDSWLRLCGSLSVTEQSNSLSQLHLLLCHDQHVIYILGQCKAAKQDKISRELLYKETTPSLNTYRPLSILDLDQFQIKH